MRLLNYFEQYIDVKKYEKVLIPELNLGQLNSIIRSKYLIDTESLNKVEGKPFTPSEIYSSINKIIKG